MMFAPSRFTAPPRPAFGRFAATVQAEPQTRTTTKAEARHMRQARLAAEVIPELPNPGESLHVILAGEIDLCSVVLAVLPRVRCTHLRLTTLAMSTRNMTELLGVLENNPAMRFTLIVSEFYKSHNKEAWQEFTSNLAEFPGAKATAARVHLKLVGFEIENAVPVIIESSADLRRNGNAEFAAVHRDEALHRFYAEFIDRMASSRHDEKEGR